jgi:hypothetical protein
VVVRKEWITVEEWNRLRERVLAMTWAKEDNVRNHYQGTTS